MGWLLRIILIVISLTALGCDGGPTDPPDRPADLTGAIVSVSDIPDDPEHSSFRLEVHGSEAGTDVRPEYIVVVTPSTGVTMMGSNGSTRTGAVEDLMVGSTVRVWTTGSERRTDPPGVDAEWVEIELVEGE